MIAKVYETIKKYDMIQPGSEVLVALSGGSDSMSLLHSLISLKDKLQISVKAAHVNHCIRGKDADDDEAFVRNECEKLGIRLYVLKTDVVKKAKETGLSVEECGRQVRYDFFRSVSSGGLIATAHNLNDRIETMLFNFTRGTSLKGLCSIPPVRDNIVRPLIECSKEEILDFCSKNNIGFVTDKTNFETDYTRNKIRINVIEELKQINPSFEKSAQRCLELINEDEKYLNSLAKEKYFNLKNDTGFDINGLYSLPIPVKKRVTAIILSTASEKDVDYKTVTDAVQLIDNYAESGNGGKLQIDTDLYLRSRAGLLEIVRSGETSVPPAAELSKGINRFGDYEITAEDLSRENSNYKSTANVYYLDFNKLEFPLIVRGRAENDKLTLPFRNITKSIRKIQNEVRMPPEEREISPVICDGAGVVCAYGCGYDKKYMIDENTVKVLKISVRKVQNNE